MRAESSCAGTWTLNVLWKMCGIDVHMDPNIGKRLNALGNTLTSLTGEEDTEDIAERTSPMADLSDEDDTDTMSPTVHMVGQVTTRHQFTNHYIVLVDWCPQWFGFLVLYHVQVCIIGNNKMGIMQSDHHPKVKHDL